MQANKRLICIIYVCMYIPVAFYNAVKHILICIFIIVHILTLVRNHNHNNYKIIIIEYKFFLHINSL